MNTTPGDFLLDKRTWAAGAATAVAMTLYSFANGNQENAASLAIISAGCAWGYCMNSENPKIRKFVSYLIERYE